MNIMKRKSCTSDMDVLGVTIHIVLTKGALNSSNHFLIVISLIFYCCDNLLVSREPLNRG